MEDIADAANGLVDLEKVVCDWLGAEDMIPVLTVGKVVVRQVCSGQNHLVVNAVQLDML